MCMSFFKALLGICRTKPLSPDLWSFNDGKIHIALSNLAELQKEGDAVYLEGAGLQSPVLIVKAKDDKYLAFENRCTHGKRKLDPVPGASTLKCCSIGHSSFDFEGNVIKGPAKKALTSYTAEISDDNLIIKL